MVESSYTVEGMTCQHCAASVSEEISELGGVTEVKVDVASGTVVVFSDNTIEHAAVEAAVTEAGYRLAS